jgi:hypothetical protein
MSSGMWAVNPGFILLLSNLDGMARNHTKFCKKAGMTEHTYNSVMW